MKKNYIYSILALFIFAQPVFSQDLTNVKIGVVDVSRLLQGSLQFQDMQSALEEEFTPRVRDIEAKESALTEARDKLTQDNLALSTDERQNSQLKLNSDARELEYLIETSREDQNIRLQIETQKILREIFDAIDKYGRDNGYDLIINRDVIGQNLTGGTLYTGASLDITNDIAIVLENSFKESKSGG